MSSLFPIQYDPEHLAYGDRASWVSATDGDTPTVQLPIRMLGMDAPELHYQGATEKTPGKYDAAMASFVDGAGKDLDDGLRKDLRERLKNSASSRHIAAGQAAFAHFEAMAQARLARTGKSGKPISKRKLFLMASEQVFDRYGRLLAYVNGAYEKAELQKLKPSQRPTFNLQMIRDGHAASLLIYPNVPKAADLELVQEALHTARTKKKGLWADPKALLAYEFRWVVDSIRGTRRHGPDRYCADFMSGKLYNPQHYYRADPENRLFFYPEDLLAALRMGFALTP